MLLLLAFFGGDNPESNGVPISSEQTNTLDFGISLSNNLTNNVITIEYCEDLRRKDWKYLQDSLPTNNTARVISVSSTNSMGFYRAVKYDAKQSSP